jgi:hypothetical protein
MKHICILLYISIFLSPLILCSQSWFEGNPQWINYRTVGISGPGIEYVTVQGDTSLGGYQAKILKRFNDKVNGNDFTNYRIARQNGDTIWCWNHAQSQYFIQYNFSLDSGATVLVPGFLLNDVQYFIDSTGTMDISGLTIRFQKVHFQTGVDYYACHSLILDKIGLVNGFCIDSNTSDTLFKGYHFFIDEPNSSQLDGPDWTFCQFLNDQINYKMADSPCEAILSATEMTEGLPVRVMPNPFQDYFTVLLPPSESIVSLRLCDLTGNTVRLVSSPGETKIHAGDLPSGVYFLEVWSSAQKRYYGILAH